MATHTSIQHVSVNSSNVRSIGYDEWSGTLEVLFHSGGLYEHTGVSPSLHHEFMEASSKGRFYRRTFYKRYGCRRIG